jgi:hypothetical protein
MAGVLQRANDSRFYLAASMPVKLLNRSLLLLSGSDFEQEADSNMDIATSVGESPSA